MPTITPKYLKSVSMSDSKKIMQKKIKYILFLILRNDKL